MNRPSSLSIWRTACECTAVALAITSAYSAFYVGIFAVVHLGWHA